VKRVRIRFKNIRYIGLHVQYRLFLSRILMKLKFSKHTFEKYLSIKSHENLLSVIELFHAEGRTDRFDMTNVIGALRIFSKAPKNKQTPHACLYSCKEESENKITSSSLDIILHLKYQSLFTIIFAFNACTQSHNFRNALMSTNKVKAVP